MLASSRLPAVSAGRVCVSRRARLTRCSDAPSDFPTRYFARRVNVTGDHWEAVPDDEDSCELVGDLARLVCEPPSSNRRAPVHLVASPAGLTPTAEEERAALATPELYHLAPLPEKPAHFVVLQPD